MKYEYKTIRQEFSEREQYKSTYREAVGDVEKRINELGKQGWRLVESREKDGWLKYGLMERIVTTAPAPQPAEPPACKNCKWFDMNGEFPCMMWQTIVGQYTPVCHKFTPKEQ